MISPDQSRAWFNASVNEFLRLDGSVISGALLERSQFDVTQTQRDAWLTTISLLKGCLVGHHGHLFLEYTVPRLGTRADAVILLGSTILVVEFKTGAQRISKADVDQVWDYALDLKNFHEGSHDSPVIPILVGPSPVRATPAACQVDPDGVGRPVVVGEEQLETAISVALGHGLVGPDLDPATWVGAGYRPTPTIIEAARALYGRHSVEEIARSDAGATNLAVTSRQVESIIDEARAKGRKAICFVTGVPGAGKTLVGLNVATRREDPNSPTHAVFLSGNGPLVSVLREALTRDEFNRQKVAGRPIRKGQIGSAVKAFIQNVHHFRDEALLSAQSPSDRVAIFDEAQRAWNLRQTSNFMRRRKNRPDFNQSEPEFLLAYMDRHEDWAAVICLVGGGQEINTGEAGISEWLNALDRHFPGWDIHISPHLVDSEYGVSALVGDLVRRRRVHLRPDMHLAVSMRSYRAESVSSFVKTVLDCEVEGAAQHLRAFRERFPLALTRDINAAKEWIRRHARGSERYGLVASSKAMRLKPHAIDIRVPVDPVYWFLNSHDDPRSSYYLEDAATEFQIQGLELDWVCVNWDADLRRTPDGWAYHDFRGGKWQSIRSLENQAYLKNAYRVLLTRARQGMVIFVPKGDERDGTRRPEFYDRTYRYLASLGIDTIDA